MIDVLDFIEHYGKKGMHWGVRNKRTASINLTSKTTGKSEKIHYNPKKLNIDYPDVGNKRQVSGSKREAKNFQKQLNKAGKNLKPKAKDLSDEDLKKAVSRMQMEQSYNNLIGKGSKTKAGSDFAKSIALNVVKTTATSLISQQVGSALKKAKISK